MQELKLKDSGITVQVRKVSPLLFIELRKQFPAPKPPLNKVIDMNGKEKWEENTANPEYLASLEKHSEDLEKMMSAVVFKRGVQVEVDLAAVEEIKQFWRESFNVELPGEDREIYIRYVVIQSEDDYESLYKAIMEKSQPTAEDINAAQQSFRS